MKKNVAIAIETTPNGEARVSEHFGRCSSFLIYTLDENNKIVKKEDQPNQLGGTHSGACHLPPYVKELGADIVIAGGMGMKAIDQFNAFGIEVITAPGFAATEALNQYLAGNIKGYEGCTAHDGEC